MDYHVPKMTLAEVFERALTALGPERVLFGTDSGTTAPYRDVDQVPAGPRARGARALRRATATSILRGNAVRIFRLDE